MSEKPEQTNEKPTLGDVLQLQAKIESLPELGLRDVGDDERIAIHRYPNGQHDSEGIMMTHIALSQRVGDSGRYKVYMNYAVLRDSHEATTRLVKRPPFELPKVEVTESGPQVTQDHVDQALGDAALYYTARDVGLFDITADELHQLSDTIGQAFMPEN